MVHNFGPIMNVSSIQLFVVLTCLCSPLVCSFMISETALGPLQVSETTWEVLEFDYSQAVFREVNFINATHGWIVGRSNLDTPADLIVLHTDDGGESWHEQLVEEDQYVMDFEVVDDQNIWVTGLGGLFFSEDGGSTWNFSEVVTVQSGMSVVKFINQTHGWTSTMQTLYKTNDSGQTWESVSGWDFDDGLREIEFRSSLDVWTIGWSGIYHSEDGAETWEQVYSYGGWGFSFVSDDEAWAVGDGILMHMADGASWHSLAIPSRAPVPRLRSPYLSDILFIDSTNGWIVGSEIPVMYTPDGGANWYEQSISEEIISRLYSIDFINSTHGWAVGSRGTILYTTNGNMIENRLWNGMTDPIFLLIIGMISAVIIGGIVRSHYSRKSNQMAKPIY